MYTKTGTKQRRLTWNICSLCLWCWNRSILYQQFCWGKAEWTCEDKFMLGMLLCFSQYYSSSYSFLPSLLLCTLSLLCQNYCDLFCVREVEDWSVGPQHSLLAVAARLFQTVCCICDSRKASNSAGTLFLVVKDTQDWDANFSISKRFTDENLPCKLLSLRISWYQRAREEHAQLLQSQLCHTESATSFSHFLFHKLRANHSCMHFSHWIFKKCSEQDIGDEWWCYKNEEINKIWVWIKLELIPRRWHHWLSTLLLLRSDASGDNFRTFLPFNNLQRALCWAP